MLTMDSRGGCRAVKGAAHPTGPPTETQSGIGKDQMTLHMWADEVATAEQLHSPGVVTVALPAPFGRSLLLEPILWKCSTGAGQTVPLNATRLDELLGTLKQTVLTEHETRVTLMTPSLDNLSISAMMYAGGDVVGENNDGADMSSEDLNSDYDSDGTVLSAQEDDASDEFDDEEEEDGI